MNENRLQGIKDRCKWRGYEEHEKSWIYGYITRVLNEKATSIEHWHVATETVGQYIGRNDKNGNEIYEGDVVRFNYQHDECSINGAIPGCDCECRGVVTYSDEYKCLGISILESEHHYLEVNDFRMFYESDIIEHIEILGNIYDNPELLNK